MNKHKIPADLTNGLSFSSWHVDELLMLGTCPKIIVENINETLLPFPVSKYIHELLFCFIFAKFRN
jgi:hypothetical protein